RVPEIAPRRRLLRLKLDHPPICLLRLLVAVRVVGQIGDVVPGRRRTPGVELQCPSERRSTFLDSAELSQRAPEIPPRKGWVVLVEFEGAFIGGRGFREPLTILEVDAEPP